jgi:hypothetical protein
MLFSRIVGPVEKRAFGVMNITGNKYGFSVIIECTTAWHCHFGHHSGRPGTACGSGAKYRNNRSLVCEGGDLSEEREIQGMGDALKKINRSSGKIIWIFRSRGILLLVMCAGAVGV